MIDGVCIKKLRMIKDNRGRLMEMIRCDDRIFKKFGQVYMTTVKPGYIKGWHCHKKQIDNFVCIKGKVRVGLYDGRKQSKTRGETQELMLSKNKHILLQIPNGVLHGFENNNDDECIIINIPTEPYNHSKPDECKTSPFKNNIPFKWKCRKGK